MPTQISWTDETWNPVRGCSRVSSGCGDSIGGGCYAERQAYRFSGPGMPYEGLVRMTTKGPRWTGKVVLVLDKLHDPLHWKKPRRIFVNSMSDLFHESLTDGEILRVFEVMQRCPQHTFQILTKRPARMLKWFQHWEDLTGESSEAQMVRGPKETRKAHPSGRGQMFAEYLDTLGTEPPPGCAWPTFDWMEGMRWWPRTIMTQPNIWLGTSVENQKTADERIPFLLQTPGVVRWISAEPLLGPIDLARAGLEIRMSNLDGPDGINLTWCVVGGESGPKARGLDLSWVRSIVSQCRAADIPVFVKQLGARPFERKPAEGPQGVRAALANIEKPHPQRTWFGDGWTLISKGEMSEWVKSYKLNDKKGGDISEFPKDLQVREFPVSQPAA